MSAAKGRRGVPEREVEAYLQEQVGLHGGFCYLVAPRGTRGPPDTVIVWPRDGWAQIHLAEIKTIGGKLEPWQEKFHENLAKLNCHVRVFWTKEQVDRYVAEHGCRGSAHADTLVRLATAGKTDTALYQGYEAVKIPRRPKRDAIRLAPPGTEFGGISNTRPPGGGLTECDGPDSFE